MKFEFIYGVVIQTLTKGGEGGRQSPKKFFSALGASVWFKNKGGRAPRAPPLGPPLTFRYDSVTTHPSLEGALYSPTEAPMMSGTCISTLDPVFFLYSLPV